MSPDDTFTVPTHVTSREVGAETVILDLASGTYFGLDPVGARIWALFQQGLTIPKVAEQLTLEFDVQLPQAESDVSTLAAELSAKGLLLTRRA